MDCREFDKLADAFVEGTLDPERNRRMSAHVSTCPSCAAVADALRQVMTALDDTGGIAAPAGFADRVRARLGNQTTGTIIPFPEAAKKTARPEIGCELFGEKVAAFADGAIESDLSRRMAEHRQHCAACDRLAHTHETVLAALESSEPVTAPAGFTARVRAAVFAGPAISTVRTISPLRKLDLLVAACVSVMVLTGLSLLGALSARGDGGLVPALESVSHRLMAAPLLFKAWVAAMIPADQWILLSRLNEPVKLPFLPVHFSLAFYLSASLTLLATGVIALRYTQSTITLAPHRR